jgi:methyl-galactoside transport system substrate-binding protein
MKKHPLTAFVLPLATAVCLCALTNGCALQTSSESESHMRQVKIGMTLYRQDDTFISTIQKNFEAIVKSREASENVKIIVNIVDGKGNQGVQNDQVDKFLSQGYDVICVNEVDRTAASVIIDKAKFAEYSCCVF